MRKWLMVGIILLMCGPAFADLTLTNGTNTNVTKTGVGGNVSVNLNTSPHITGSFTADGVLYGSMIWTDGFIYGNGSHLTGILTGTPTQIALSPTPTLCTAGNYARGIDANGNATGCSADQTGGGGSISGLHATAVPVAASATSIVDSSIYQVGAVNVGIGSVNPRGTLDVRSATGVDGFIYGNGSQLTGITASMVYPGSGIANSTGSSWGTSYSTQGSGTVVVLATSPTITTPTIAKLANLTTNGIVRTSGGDGTLSVDTTVYAPYSTFTGLTANRFPRATGTGLVDSVIYESSSNIGIGTSLPRGKLDVAGDIYADGAIYLGTSSGGYVDLNNQAAVRFYETTGNGSNHVDLIAPASLSANTTYTLPSADGTSGQALVTNGSGALSFADAGGGSGTAITVGNTNATVADTGTDGDFKVTTEGTLRMTINSTGFIGFGMTPGTSDVKIQGTSVINNTNGGGGALAVCKSGSTSKCLRFSVQDNNSSSDSATIQGAYEGNSYLNTIINPIGGSVMVGPADGTSPRAMLDVHGGIAATGGSANHAVCWKSTGVLGYCSAAVDSSGVCGTCN